MQQPQPGMMYASTGVVMVPQQQVGYTAFVSQPSYVAYTPQVQQGLTPDPEIDRLLQEREGQLRSRLAWVSVPLALAMILAAIVLGAENAQCDGEAFMQRANGYVSRPVACSFFYQIIGDTIIMVRFWHVMSIIFAVLAVAFGGLTTSCCRRSRWCLWCELIAIGIVFGFGCVTVFRVWDSVQVASSLIWAYTIAIVVTGLYMLVVVGGTTVMLRNVVVRQAFRAQQRLFGPSGAPSGIVVVGTDFQQQAAPQMEYQAMPKTL